MIERLPVWVLTEGRPAFYDSESVTAIEMVAKLYGKMNELVENYNEFATQVNTEIDRFESGLTADFEDFKSCLQQLVLNYIESIDMKIAEQDLKIDNAIEGLQTEFAEAIADGTITADLNVSYDSETENIVFSIVATGGSEEE